MNNNLFYDGDAPTEIDSTPIDLSGITKAEVLPENSVLMRMEIKGTEFQKQFSPSEVIDEHAGIDSTLVNTTKRLIDKRYLDPISKLDSRMRSDLYQIGMRPSFLGAGNVIIPLKLVHYTIKRIEEYKAERKQLVENLIDRWEEAKLETLSRSPDLYYEYEYPDAAEVRQRFQVEYSLFSVAFPDVLARLEAEIAVGVGERIETELDGVRRASIEAIRQQQETQKQQLEEAVDECRQGLRAGFYELVSNLEDKVRGIGSERKVFKPGFVNAMRTFLETFDAKNITNDEELAGMVERARMVLSGVSPDSIRNNLDVKLKIEAELGVLKNNLADLTENRVRKASFK